MSLCVLNLLNQIERRVQEKLEEEEERERKRVKLDEKAKRAAVRKTSYSIYDSKHFPITHSLVKNTSFTTPWSINVTIIFKVLFIDGSLLSGEKTGV